MKIAEITIEKLKAGEFEEELPELYELKEVIENNKWHPQKSVFDHTLAVLEKLEEQCQDIAELDEKIGKYTKRELLFLVGLFHDIGKKETFVEELGKTRCPHHEQIGGEKVKEILERFKLSAKQKDFVVRLISHHGLIHRIIDLSNPDLERDYNTLKKNLSDVLLVYLLLAQADTASSALSQHDSEEYRIRMEFYQDAIADARRV